MSIDTFFGSLTTITVKMTKNGWMTVNKKPRRHAILLKLFNDGLDHHWITRPSIFKKYLRSFNWWLINRNYHKGHRINSEHFLRMYWRAGQSFFAMKFNENQFGKRKQFRDSRQHPEKKSSPILWNETIFKISYSAHAAGIPPSTLKTNIFVSPKSRRLITQARTPIVGKVYQKSAYVKEISSM